MDKATDSVIMRRLCHFNLTGQYIKKCIATDQNQSSNNFQISAHTFMFSFCIHTLGYYIGDTAWGGIKEQLP